MNNADREQFVDALSKLTMSRGKHKKRADDMETEMKNLERKCMNLQEHNERTVASLQECT